MKVTVHTATPKMKFPIGSWLIKLVEWGKISDSLPSHVALSIELAETVASFESVVPMSRIVTQYRWIEHYQALESWDIEISATESEAMGWLLDNTDRAYSRFQCFLLGLGDLCGGWVRTLVRKQNPNGSDYLICVEAMVRFLLRFTDVRWSQSPDMVGLAEFVDTMRKRK